MIRKLLIANRGEIACRIMRTCREMGIATVAVYSEADAQALHVEIADEGICLGSEPLCYLNQQAILAAVQRTEAHAVHPGYGFLAENAEFARLCTNSGCLFLGPSAEVIERMGNKRSARKFVEGMAQIPGYDGANQSLEAFVEAAQKLGCPLLVKAAAGGGGKGMQRVDCAKDLPLAIEIARREARSAFGDDTLLLEKFLPRARHIEVQIFGDTHGNIIVLGERECSIQRRYQKLIEETPAPEGGLTPKLRREIAQAAQRIAHQLRYCGPGTVEFLVAGENFYFLEMNTRLQVEHPVTEMATGLDLVRLQIEVAEGKSLANMPVATKGYAVECRICAEDCANDFVPATGTVLHWEIPREVRIDRGIRSGDEVTPYYDSLLAKVIAWGETREVAIRRLDFALAKIQLLGVVHNIAFLRRVLQHKKFLAGDISNQFLVENSAELFCNEKNLPPIVLISASLSQISGQGYWRNNPNRAILQRFSWAEEVHEILVTPALNGLFAVEIASEEYRVRQWQEGVLEVDGHRQRVTVVQDGENLLWLHYHGETYVLQKVSLLSQFAKQSDQKGSLRAPMPGKIVEIAVEVGEYVEKGQTLLTLEAMKMEHRIKAPYAGKVMKTHYSVGQTVEASAILLTIAED